MKIGSTLIESHEGDNLWSPNRATLVMGIMESYEINVTKILSLKILE